MIFIRNKEIEHDINRKYAKESHNHKRRTE